MDENADHETAPSDAERRHVKTRAYLINALSGATAAAALTHYQPDGLIATVIIFVGAYVVATLLWGFLWITSAILLAFLSALIYMATLIMGLSSLPGILLSAFLPGLAQAYWIWALWPATATLSHPLTLACVAWLALAGITMFEQNLFSNWRWLSGKLGLRRDRVAPKHIGDHRPW